MPAEALRSGQENFLRDAEEVAEWARDEDGKKGITLLEVVKNAKPTVLIGCSTMTGAFNEQVGPLCVVGGLCAADSLVGARS
jgi:malate dehydrogenase (oxaloacetate-decarboxylating)